ncbi:MAG: hypothetical protein IKQ41_04635 [Clostridia bacterium]|nr:hypothetical protein [Clostridia bacterium]
MRRIIICLIALVLALGFFPAAVRAEGSFVVDEDEDTPDLKHQARAMMQRMTDEQKIYQLFFVTVEDLTGESRSVALPDENVFLKYPVGGVILFGQNIESEEQLRALTQALSSQASKAGLYPLFLGVDEEGGLVSRVANKLGYRLAMSPEEIGASGNEALAYSAGRQIAAYLAPLGINMTFAPSLDTWIDQEKIGVQTYGSDPKLVSRMASHMASGLRDGGLLPCFGHFPGHGTKDGTLLSNIGIPRTLDDMRTLEWLPFQDMIDEDAEMILISHGKVSIMGEDVHTSMSYAMISNILRGQMGFQGVVVTDSLRMNAITSNYKKGQESVAALKAGADLLLLPPDLDKAVAAIRAALSSGELTMARIEESVERILAVKIRMSAIR